MASGLVDENGIALWPLLRLFQDVAGVETNAAVTMDLHNL